MKELYDGIMARGCAAVESGSEFIDLNIGDPSDTRMGVIAVIRPTSDVRKRISDALDELRKIDGCQYYYPETDFHITLFEVITGKSGFVCTQEQREMCIALTRDVSDSSEGFSVNMKGLALTEGCVIAKGFCGSGLQKIRERFRSRITSFGLVLEERYPTKSCHITVARFRKSIERRMEFISKVKNLCDADFGSFQVSQVELVCHDWYDSKKEVFGRFNLTNQ